MVVFRAAVLLCCWMHTNALHLRVIIPAYLCTGILNRCQIQFHGLLWRDTHASAQQTAFPREHTHYTLRSELEMSWGPGDDAGVSLAELRRYIQRTPASSKHQSEK